MENFKVNTISIGPHEQGLLDRMKQGNQDIRTMDIFPLLFANEFAELTGRSGRRAEIDLRRLQVGFIRAAGFLVGDVGLQVDPNYLESSFVLDPKGYLVIGRTQQRIYRQYRNGGVDLRALNSSDPHTIAEFRRRTRLSETSALDEFEKLQQKLIRIAGWVVTSSP